VRIILRDIGDARKMLEALQLRGFDMSVVKLQKACHNKGIIVDSKVVALGSHNWSSDGTTTNRDATLIIHDPQVAAYYEEVFLFDWDNQARQKAPAAKDMPVVAKPGRAKRRDVGTVAIPWSSYFED
jgi:phosphatidylserine/phosphatidylglycerophosphate/cardiolipin synthase-like enzyme